MVREVKAGERTLPVHFGMAALLEFSHSQERAFEELFSNLEEMLATIESKLALAICGVNHGFRKTGSDEKITQEDLLDMMDENPVILDEIFLIFTDQTLERAARQAESLGNLEERTAAITAKQKALLGTGSKK